MQRLARVRNGWRFVGTRPARCVGLVIAAVCAQPVKAEAPELATIIVTGERVPRALSNTASSVVVFTQAAISTVPRADRLDQLLLLTPNIQIGSGSEGPAIRGQDSTGPLQQLGAFLGGTRPRATLQVDGRPLGYNELVFAGAPTWDVRQVEVFRSPQTTTQGRNAIAGAIFVETNDPEAAPAGAARVQLADNDFHQVSAMVNLPLADQQLAIRVAGDLRRGRPWSNYAQAVPGADLDRDDYSLLRAKLSVTPSRLPDLDLLVTYTHAESYRPQYLTAAVPPYTNRAIPRFERTNGVYDINSDALVGRFEVGLSPGVSWRTLLSYADVDVRRLNQPGFGRNFSRSTDYFLESRLAIAPANGREAVIGISWLRQDLDQQADLAGVGLGTGRFDDRQTSFGVFGEGSAQLLPQLALTLGLRYQRDRQVRRGETGPLPNGARIAFDKTYEAWLPKLVLSWTPRPAIGVGLLVQRAYNPGGTSLVFRTRRQADFAAETLWNIEAFAHLRSTDGRFAAEARIFHLDMRDNQRTLLVPVTLPDGSNDLESRVANAPRAWSRGVEASASFRPNASLAVGIAVGLLDTRIVETLARTDPSRGKAFQRAPGLSGSATIDWTPVPELTLSVQGRGWSSYFSDDANSDALRIGGGAVIDAGVAWRHGPLTVRAWARNLFDRDYFTYLFAPVGSQPPLATIGDPRQIGLGVEARF